MEIVSDGQGSIDHKYDMYHDELGENLKLKHIDKKDGKTLGQNKNTNNKNNKIKMPSPTGSNNDNGNTRDHATANKGEATTTHPNIITSPLPNFKLPSENRHHTLINHQYKNVSQQQIAIKGGGNNNTSISSGINHRRINTGNSSSTSSNSTTSEDDDAVAIDEKNHISDKIPPMVSPEPKINATAIDNTISNSLNILSTRKRGKCNIKNSDNVPHVITQLVIDMINVVSFRVSISLNEHLVSELETYQHQGWKKEIEQRKCVVIEQRNAAKKRLRLNEIKRKERLQRLTNCNRRYRQRMQNNKNGNNVNLSQEYHIKNNQEIERDKIKHHMEEYIQKVTKHIGLKKEAAVWKQVPQPGRMPKPPSNTSHHKKHHTKHKHSHNKKKKRRGDRKMQQRSHLDNAVANALSPRSLIPKRPVDNSVASGEKISNNSGKIVDKSIDNDDGEKMNNGEVVVSKYFGDRKTSEKTGNSNKIDNKEIIAKTVTPPINNASPKRPQTANARLNMQRLQQLDSSTNNKVQYKDEVQYPLSPRLRLLHHSNVKRVSNANDLFSLDDSEDTTIKNMKSATKRSLKPRPSTSSRVRRSKHRLLHGQQITGESSDAYAAITDDTTDMQHAIQTSPIYTDRKIDIAIRDSQVYALKALDLLSQATSYGTSVGEEKDSNDRTNNDNKYIGVEKRNIISTTKEVNATGSNDYNNNTMDHDKNHAKQKAMQQYPARNKKSRKKTRPSSASKSKYSAGSGANVVMARRKSSKTGNSNNGNRKEKVIQAGLPGWSGPAGSSLQRNGSYTTKAESFSFAIPNLQLQLVSRSRSSRPWEKTRGFNNTFQHTSPNNGRRVNKSSKSKSSKKKPQHQQTPLERWQSETETIIKRLNQIRVQQGNTLRSEQESRKGKEIRREKTRWKELMQREHKREMKILKREMRTEYHPPTRSKTAR